MKPTARPEKPSPEQLATLPPYPALPPSRIHLLKTPEQFAAAEAALRAAASVGFDTESKPVFVAGAPHTGPEVIQFATVDQAFIVQTAHPGAAAFLQAMIESDEVVKVGFGLASDRPQIQRRLGLRLGACVDLSFLVKKHLGFRQPVGLKTAVALVLGQRLSKSRKVTTSNWAAAQLSPQQLQYAAHDAQASLRVYLALPPAPAAPR